MTPDKVSSVSEPMRLAGDILPHSTSAETALQYEKRAIIALAGYLALRSSAPRTSEDAEWLRGLLVAWPVGSEDEGEARLNRIADTLEGSDR